MVFQLNHIQKQFDENLILEDVSLVIEEGTIHGMIGYNGAGKSTTAKIIGGVCSYDAGEIVIDGKVIKEWNVTVAMKHGVYFADNHSTLLPELTIMENMLYGLNSMSKCGTLGFIVGRNKIKKKLQHYINRLHLPCKVDQRVGELTNSLRNVLELIRICMFEPKLIVIDELDSSVNKYDKDIIRALMMELKEKNVAVLYISHQIEYALSVSDIISIIMNKHILQTIRTDSREQDSMLEILFCSTVENPPKTIIEPQAVILEMKNIKTGLIDNFSMEVREGEIVGIIGLEKEGPASFEEILFLHKYQNNNKSKIYVREQEVKLIQPKDAVKYGIVFLDANILEKYIFNECTVWENMLPYSVKIKHKSEKVRIKICQDYLKKLHIEAEATDMIESLSTGAQKKILLARNILSEGELFIFNSPTDNIDTVSKVDIYNIINELKSRGNGIVVISNDYHEIAGISDYIIVVQNGKIVKKYHNLTNHEKEIFENKTC